MHTTQEVIATTAASGRFRTQTCRAQHQGSWLVSIAPFRSKLACCRGHNGKVRSIVWSPDDTKLVSGGMDGAVYEWRIKDLKREKENVLKVRCVDCLFW